MSLRNLNGKHVHLVPQPAHIATKSTGSQTMFFLVWQRSPNKNSYTRPPLSFVPLLSRPSTHNPKLLTRIAAIFKNMHDLCPLIKLTWFKYIGIQVSTLNIFELLRCKILRSTFNIFVHHESQIPKTFTNFVAHDSFRVQHGLEVANWSQLFQWRIQLIYTELPPNGFQMPLFWGELCNLCIFLWPVSWNPISLVLVRIYSNPFAITSSW